MVVAKRVAVRTLKSTSGSSKSLLADVYSSCHVGCPTGMVGMARGPAMVGGVQGEQPWQWSLIGNGGWPRELEATHVFISTDEK